MTINITNCKNFKRVKFTSKINFTLGNNEAWFVEHLPVDHCGGGGN